MFNQVYIELEMEMISLYKTGDIGHKPQIFSTSIHFTTLFDKIKEMNSKRVT